DEDLAARLDTDVRALVRADPGAFDVAAEPEPEISPGPACLGLAPAKIHGADHLDGHREAGRIVAAVVASRRAVLEREPHVPRKVVGLDAGAAPHLGRLEPGRGRGPAER